MSDIAPDLVIDRIRSRVEVAPNGCWMWTGATSSGYGRITFIQDGKRVWRQTHRVMYAAEFGPVPQGLDVDHQCHDPDTCRPTTARACPHRRCCNPAHLKPLTRRDNLLRGDTATARRAATTHCPRGHAYDESNTLTDKLGRRICKECTYERNRAYYWANRERRMAYNKAWHANRRDVNR